MTGVQTCALPILVLGNIELTFPGDLNIELRIGSVLSSVEFHDQRSMVPRSGRTVRVTGSCFLGNVEVTAATESFDAL